MTERTTREERERWRANWGVCAEIALVPDNWPARCRRLLADLDAAEAEVERLREALREIDDDPPIGMSWEWHRQKARDAALSGREGANNG